MGPDELVRMAGRIDETMTALQEQAIQIIKRMPDERLTRAVRILRDMEDEGANEAETSLQKSRAAYKTLMSFCRKGTISGDYKKELAKARDERYEGAR